LFYKQAGEWNMSLGKVDTTFTLFFYKMSNITREDVWITQLW